jgi:hypothetical protein
VITWAISSACAARPSNVVALPGRPRALAGLADPVDIRRGGGSGSVSLPAWTEEKPPTTVPLLELRRVVGNWREAGVANVRLDYLRGEGPHSVANVLTDPDLGAPLPWWQQHLLSFRAISSADGPDICRW